MKRLKPSHKPAVAGWVDRVWRECHARNFTLHQKDVLMTLHTFRGELICPSQAILAKRSRTSVETVRRALKQAERLGLLVRHPRRRWVGRRYLRTSDRYFLTVPETPVIGGFRPKRNRIPLPRISTGQWAAGGDSEYLERTIEAEKPRSLREQVAFFQALGVPIPINGGSAEFQRAMRG